jgi:hypothetical protein
MNEPKHEHRFPNLNMGNTTEIVCLDCGQAVKVEHVFDEEGFMRTKLLTEG